MTGRPKTEAEWRAQPVRPSARSDRGVAMAVKHGTAEARVVELRALLRRMLASNEMSNGWKDEILTELQRK